MPRKRELTWQAGSQRRPGRWRKKYQGRAYYFPGGNGKTDQVAYQAAANAWLQQQARLQAAAPKRHQANYEREIDQWSKVLAWSRQHGEEPMMAVATEKIAVLRTKWDTAKPKPLDPGDTFDGFFVPETRDPKFGELMKWFRAQWSGISAKPYEAPCSRFEAFAEIEFSELLQSVPDPPKRSYAFDVPSVFTTSYETGEPRIVFTPDEEKPTLWDKLKLEKEIWQDRLQLMERSAPEPDRTVVAQVGVFLRTKEQEAGASGVSVSRIYALRLHLTGFADWLGGRIAVDKISGQDLINYRLHLLKQVAEDKLSRTTASDRLSSVKSFIRWLWQTEAITELPRVLHPRSKMLEIGKSSGKILTYTEAEIATLISRASERTRLYILLTLNTGMTQKDISDLLDEEVDWEQNRIIRKRSKTRKSTNVPTVSYQLWPETIALLRKHRSHGGTGRVLLNSRGEPLLSERFGEDGKYWKMDNVRNAFDRLRRKTEINKPFKSLKKTSASLLRQSERFSSVVGLFLGHAPREISDRHYASAPQRLLDNSLLWLHDHFATHKCFESRVPK